MKEENDNRVCPKDQYFHCSIQRIIPYQIIMTHDHELRKSLSLNIVDAE